MKPQPFVPSVVLLALLGPGDGSAGHILSDELRGRCYEVLTKALDDESKWVCVHAAEALVWLKRPQAALVAFWPKADTTEPQYRVVVWRVLAAAEPEAAQRSHYVERIRAALLDPHGPDQTHAMEALAKLREPAADDAERRRVREVADGEGPASPFAVWRLAQANDATAVDRLMKLLRSNEPTTRARAAYVLGQLQPLPAAAASDALAAALEKELPDSAARVMIHAAQGERAVRALARDTDVAPSGRYFAAMRLAECGTAEDLPVLTRLLNDPDSDVCVGAAYALLCIDGRSSATTKVQAK